MEGGHPFINTKCIITSHDVVSLTNNQQWKEKIKNNEKLLKFNNN